MRLRNLKEKDAPLMLEWMHDELVVKDLRTDFASKTIQDCLSFIECSKDSSNNLHMAIVDDYDRYLGTCSLKHINHDVHTAELGITVRAVAMGQGISADAMRQIIEYGEKELEIKTVYWCVDPNNLRALRFYDKNGYERIDIMSNQMIYREAKWGYSAEDIQRYVWYLINQR